MRVIKVTGCATLQGILGSMYYRNTVLHREVTYLQYIRVPAWGSRTYAKIFTPLSCTGNWRFPMEDEVSSWLAISSLSHSRVSRSRKPVEYLWRENTGHSCFGQCWGGGIRLVRPRIPRSWGYGKTANSKHNFWLCLFIWPLDPGNSTESDGKQWTLPVRL